jgi:asparagine synthase (glutamine-hydrolysing)
MCGLAGFLTFDAATSLRGREERRAVLAAMSAQVARRGPDDETLFDDGALALAFRRLSIVDVAGGRQPLSSEDGSLVVAVNGEIYDHEALRGRLRREHRFATRSDAEVLVHLFEERGTDAFALLHGMFAAVVWDARSRRLVLARDRLGIKPLYVARTPDGVLFASELKALLVHPGCPTELEWADVDASFLDLPQWFPMTPGRLPSYVRGVEHLPGGALLEATPAGDVRTRTWWSLEPALARSLEEPPRPAAAYAAEYADLLEDVVRDHLMSDVPLGALLSGGLDSSLLVALAARGRHDVACWSVLADTTLASGDVQRARSLCRRLGLPFHPVRFDEGFLDALDFGLPELEYFVWTLDGPKLDPDWLLKHELYRYAKTATPEVKVALVGQGADEFAGGYSRTNGVARTWAAHLERRRRLHVEARRRAAGVDPRLAPFLAEPPPRGDAQHDDAREALEHLQYHNLWHEDRTSSAHGIEARVPYLDHRLVELLASVPPALHAELFLDKAIVREAARRWLPPEIASAPKVPSWLSRDPSSTLETMRRLARRAYAGFRESYLGDGSGLLDADAMETLHARTEGPGGASVAAAKTLLLLMAVAVFDRLCRRLRSGHEVRRLLPPSPLVAEPDFAEPDARAEHAVPASGGAVAVAGVRVPASSTILVDLGGRRARLESEGAIRGALDVEDDVWVLDLLHEVSARPGSSAGALAAGLGRDASEVEQVLSEFVEAGWLEPVRP